MQRWNVEQERTALERNHDSREEVVDCKKGASIVMKCLEREKGKVLQNAYIIYIMLIDRR